MISQIVCGLFTPGAACAQGVAASGAQTVVIIDFANKTGDPRNDVIARLATDAVAVEMANTARYEVLKRDEVVRQANELGLRPPYDQIARSRLAQALGASAIV